MRQEAGSKYKHVALPVTIPPAKTIAIDDNYIIHNLYYDIELFNKEVSKPIKYKISDMEVGDWCMSNHGCIVQLLDKKISGDKIRLYFPNHTFLVRIRKDGTHHENLYYTHFGKTVPLTEIRQKLKYSSVVIELMRGGMDFRSAFKVAHCNIPFKTQATMYQRMIKSQKFLAELTLLEAILETEKPLKERLENAGIKESKYLTLINSIIDSPEKYPAGVVTKAMAFVEASLGLNNAMDKLKAPMTNKDATGAKISEIREEASRELRAVKNIPNQQSPLPESEAS